MDVIINNPPAAPVAPAPQYFQNQGYGYAPAPWVGRDNDGPGFGGILFFLLGGFLLFRFLRFRGRGRGMRFVGPQGVPNGGPGDFFRRERQRFFGAGFFGDGALDIARERFAKGEITAQEFEAIRRTLAGDPATDA